MNHLKEQINKRIKAAEGTWAVSLEHINSNKTWAYHGDESFNAASIIKLPIMAAAFSAVEQGKFMFHDELILEREDQVGGMGVLQHLTPGLHLSIYDLMTLMIIQSDNTATNMIIDMVGKEQIQLTIQELGMNNSQYYRELMTMPVQSEGTNKVTANDVNIFLKTVLKGKYVSQKACEQMIDIMKRQQAHDFPNNIPKDHDPLIGVQPSWEIASKSGRVYQTQHDAGIFYVDDHVMLVTILSKNCDNIVGKQTLAKIGKDVYDYMKGAN